jgi:hypothetical protein
VVRNSHQKIATQPWRREVEKNGCFRGGTAKRQPVVSTEPASDGRNGKRSQVVENIFQAKRSLVPTDQDFTNSGHRVTSIFQKSSLAAFWAAAPADSSSSSVGPFASDRMAKSVVPELKSQDNRRLSNCARQVASANSLARHKDMSLGGANSRSILRFVHEAP